MVGQRLIESDQSVVVFGLRVEDLATPEGIVRDHGATNAQILRGPFQVIGIVCFVRVDEHQIVRRVRFQLWQHLGAGALQYGHFVGETGALKVGTGEIGVDAAFLDRDQFAAGG